MSGPMAPKRRVSGQTDPDWSTIAALADIADELAALRRTLAIGILTEGGRFTSEYGTLLAKAATE